MRRIIGAVALGSLLLSCSSINDSGGAVLTSQAVTLSASSPTVTGIGWEGTPPPDNYQLTVTVALTNVAASMPLSATADHFSLITDMARALTPTSVSQECRGGERLAIGGHVTCQLVFSLSRTQRPARVTYDGGAGATATATVPAVDLTPLPLTDDNACLAREEIRHNETSRQCTECADVYCVEARAGYNRAMDATPAQGCTLLGCVYDDTSPTADRCACVHACFSPTVFAAYADLARCYVNRCWQQCAHVSSVRDAGR